MPNRKFKGAQRLKNNLIYCGALLVFRLARLIPLRWGIRLGVILGGAAWLVLGHERRCSLAHLKVAFPDWTDAERAATGQASFRHLGRCLFELFHFDEILATIGTDHPTVVFQGRENMVRALEEGRGGLFFTGHIGNWELMAATVTHSGLPGNEIVRRLYDDRLDRLLNDHRRKYKYKPMTRGGAQLVEDITNTLMNNELIGLLLDQDTKVRGVFADWFGHPAWTPSGPAYLAYTADLNIMFLENYRKPDGTYVVNVSAPLPRPMTGDLKADIQAYTQMMNDRLCDHIRQYPEQWVWMHRRWKTRPPGEPPEKHPAPRPPKPYHVKRRLARWLARPVQNVSWETAARVGEYLGGCWRRLLPGRAQEIRARLAAALPDSNESHRAAILRAAFAGQGRTLVEYARHRRMDRAFFEERVTLEGEERLATALREGRGVILATGPFTAWEIALWKLAVLGYSLHVTIPPHPDKFLDLRRTWMRRAPGVTPHRPSIAAAAARRALANGELWAALPLPDDSEEGVPVEFLGRPLKLSALPARLARESGAPVLPLFSDRPAPGRYRITIGEPLTPAADDAATTRGLAALLAARITAEPQTWPWTFPAK